MRIDEVAWDHPASVALRQAQRDEIELRYGTPDSEPGPAPTGDDIVAFYVAFSDEGEPLGCGGLRPLNDSEGEVKRMFVTPSSRGTGTSTAILTRLEASARDRGWIRLLLETGDQQPDAIRFYTREGYLRAPNFGYYVGNDASLCFAKEL